MEKLMTYENLFQFAYVNDGLISGKIKGIVVEFLGLGVQQMYADSSFPAEKKTAESVNAPQRTYFYGERNILYLIPYTNPWSWCNKQALDYVEEVLDVLFDHYHLPEDIPIVSTGGSMGGLTAIAYTKFARRTPVACAADCPSCELDHRYRVIPHLARTVYSAFCHQEGTIEEAIRSVSPIDLMDELPPIPYHIFHCDLDVGYESRKTFVEGMKARGHEVTFDIAEGRGHCNLTEEMLNKYQEYCAEEIEKACR